MDLILCAGAAGGYFMPIGRLVLGARPDMRSKPHESREPLACLNPRLGDSCDRSAALARRRSGAEGELIGFSTALAAFYRTT